MLRIIVDSGSSIKQNEKEKYNVDILPLKILFDEDEYEDDIDLTLDLFYKKLIDEKKFPKTSLPNLEYAMKLVDEYTNLGDDILIITFSSQLSGTYSALCSLFQDYENVRIVDSLTAVGGIRILVSEANKYKDKGLDFLAEHLTKLRDKIQVLGIPETLTYLLRGGRLSKKEWLLGTLISIKPIISLVDGKVKVIGKKRGIKQSMREVNNLLNEIGVDLNYEIVAEYSYNIENAKELVNNLDEQYQNKITEYDNLDAAVACHWGPNAFGLVFVKK